MAGLSGAILIFLLRITDVSLGTLRVLYTVRGQRLTAASLGALEAGVFIFAITTVFKHLDNPLNMVGYALGFSCGTALGMTLERWIASGYVLARVISREKSAELLGAMRAASFGVTAIDGAGMAGKVLVLFIVARRKRSGAMLQLVREIDPKAFISIDPVSPAMGGYLPITGAAAVRK
jgi:uncharacterized protein YebE (UPF0316 family)